MRRLPRSKRGLQNARRHGIASAHVDVTFEAELCGHRAVAIPQVRVSRVIAASPRQQSA